MKSPVEMSAYLNARLNAPTVEDLVAEADAIVYEIECRIRKAEIDRRTLAAARQRAVRAILPLKPAPVQRRMRTAEPMTSASLSKGD